MQRDSVSNTILVATLLCIVCSVLVSGAAVLLRDRQEANRVEERKRNILKAAGLYDAERPLDELFRRVEPRVIDLASGDAVDASVINPDEYDQQAAAKDPEMSVAIPAPDIAGLRRRAKYAVVYEIYETSDKRKLEKLVIPIEGKGLWSTLYGYLALNAEDLTTIEGITFYQHGETPGLGGEVDNENWKDGWKGKEAFTADSDVQIEVVKGNVDPNSPGADHQVDGLAGATITARGVSNLVRFWLGPDGFEPYLDRLRNEGQNTSPDEVE